MLRFCRMRTNQPAYAQGVGKRYREARAGRSLLSMYSFGKAAMISTINRIDGNRSVSSQRDTRGS